MAAIRATTAENISTGSGGFSHEHGSVTMFTSITAPVLRSVDPPVVTKFLKELERYKLEVASNKAELPLLQIAFYSASIDRSLLQNLVFMGALEDRKVDATVATLTEDNIKEFIRSFISNESHKVNPAQPRKTIKGCKLP